MAGHTGSERVAPDVSGVRVVVSFDIDGTMEFGEPPGPIPVAFVADLVAEGHVVGCASDRGRSSQAPLWHSHGVELHFVGGKHHLPEVRAAYRAERYVHIGDTHVDRHYAGLAEFEFVSVHDLDRPAIADADCHATLRSVILGS
jgi:hypothetical protein